MSGPGFPGVFSSQLNLILGPSGLPVNFGGGLPFPINIVGGLPNPLPVTVVGSGPSAQPSIANFIDGQTGPSGLFAKISTTPLVIKQGQLINGSDPILLSKDGKISIMIPPNFPFNLGNIDVSTLIVGGLNPAGPSKYKVYAEV